ncbi:hypothetical protein ACJMK2_005237, partial [Sinanodonta woodiana]
SALNLNALQARIPSRSEEAICGSIPVIQYYVKYLACRRQLDGFASYNGSRHCG